MSDDPDVMSVVTHLCLYLRAHPRSADTAEGAARWWFGSAPWPTTEKVQAALRWMQALGVVEALRAADGRVRFRANSKLADIDTRLAALAARPCGDSLPSAGAY